MRRAAAALGLVCAVVLAGCGEDESEPTTSPTSSEPTTGSTPSESSDGPTSGSPGTSLDVTVEDGSVTPNGVRVDVARGEEVTMVVKADVAGTMHVHSTPDQSLPYEPGTTTLRFSVDQPGMFEVEDEALGIVVVQLEVR